MHLIRYFLPVVVVVALLASPAIAVNFFGLYPQEAGPALGSVLAAVLVFLIPIGFFHKCLKWYFYLLLPFAALIPLLLFSILFVGLTPGFELVAFVLQTNPREVKEAVGPFLPSLLFFQAAFLAIYCWAVCCLPAGGFSRKQGICVSTLSVVLLSVVTVFRNGLYDKSISEITKHDFFLEYDYPMSLAFGIRKAGTFLRRNNLDQSRDFFFRAVRNDTISQRRICVLIIGESSRYDRWQVNGYRRETSPRLAKRHNLLTYSDVVSGAHYTWMAVPQIITRANPDNYNAQYREKSILAAFKEAGFNTYWLSNQSDQDIFWSGSITLHAKTADFYCFSPSYSPNLEYDRIYDGRLLPLLDSVVRADANDLFIVLHTMGNHWDYSQRYPPEFDRFQPSGYTQDINPPTPAKRNSLLNSYDNSILYADFVIDSVIRVINHTGAIATVTYISDHGEDLFDADSSKLDFHFRPSAATLKVPLFMWASESYRNTFPAKWTNLKRNVSSKIGTENVFHTLADIGNLKMESLDSTKSFAHTAFIPSRQKFYGDDKKARLFVELQ